MPSKESITREPAAVVPSQQQTTFPSSEVRVLRARLDLALALIVELMDAQHYPLHVSARLKLAAAAIQVRGVLESVANRSALWESPPQVPPRLFPHLTVHGLLSMVASRDDLPAMVRQAAMELRDEGREADATDTRRLLDLSAYFVAARDITGLGTRETARALSENADWHDLSPTRITVAVALHRAACRLVGVQS